MELLKKPHEIKLLYQPEGNAGCFATNRITVDGEKVGYMYRELPDEDSHFPDSGWRFFAGDESDEYLAVVEHIHIYHLNTVVNYDPAIMAYLNAPYGTAWVRQGDVFVSEELVVPNIE